jgi:hypothetical protein
MSLFKTAPQSPSAPQAHNGDSILIEIHEIGEAIRKMKADKVAKVSFLNILFYSFR